MLGPSLNHFLWLHLIIIPKITTHQVMVLYQAIDPFTQTTGLMMIHFPYKIKQQKCLEASMVRGWSGSSLQILKYEGLPY